LILALALPGELESIMLLALWIAVALIFRAIAQTVSAVSDPNCPDGLGTSFSA
jgi:hypothetical protein